MIGVHAPDSDPRIVAEFFELFKTPWEMAVKGRLYEAVVGTDEGAVAFEAPAYFLYCGRQTRSDRETVSPGNAAGTMLWHEESLPIFGGLVTAHGSTTIAPATSGSRPVVWNDVVGATRVTRIGYDLFHETGHILRHGQPVEWARVPTLDLHVDILRGLLSASRVSFVEVPPRPADADFICCLTHDVDFFGIRRHRADKTLAGFVTRATVGGLRDLARRRRTVTEVGTNLRAAVTLPLVWAGLKRDFWQPFDDYARVESGGCSTFFLVPFKSRPGVSPAGTSEPQRAVPYAVAEIAAEARRARARGSELGVHGLDAWRDTAAGRAELAEVTQATGQADAGIRMHWLYFDAGSPARLEAAGFAYDSTWGYNETVGYRAGTSQAFVLPGTRQLMELPMTIMDSAMLSGRRLAMAPAAAESLWRPIVDRARRAGGAVVINWHERSLAPERLWGRAYTALLAHISAGNRAWFTTAGRAVEWFRWRRSITFERDGRQLRVVAPPTSLPAGLLRVTRPAADIAEYQDVRLDSGCVTVPLPGATRQDLFPLTIN
jgi:hypothetical protein